FRAHRVLRQRTAVADDRDDRTLRRDEIADRGPVLVEVVEAGDVVHLLHAERFELWPERRAMIDDVVGAHGLRPRLGFRSRCRGDDREAGHLGELDADRAYATGAADDEDRGAAIPSAEVDLHAVEEAFPGSDRSERHRGGLREVQFLRLGPDDMLVDEMELTVAAGARDVAGVVNLIARLEER